MSRDAEFAELPDSAQPPVGRLIERGRARRTRRAVLAAVCAAVVVAAIVAAVVATLPSAPSSPARRPVADRVPSSGLIGGLAPTGPGPSVAALSHFHWSALPRSPLGSQALTVLAWTGKNLIELANPANPANRYGPAPAAAFNLATRTWRRIAPVPGGISAAHGPFGELTMVAAWTGHVLFVTGYGLAPGAPGSGVPAGLYDPVTNRWTRTAMPPAMRGVTSPFTAIWTGRDIVVAGTGEGRIDLAAYNPATRRWTMISPSVPAGHPTDSVAMVVTSDRLILLSHWYRSQSRHHPAYVPGDDVIALDEADRWTTITGVGWPQDRYIDNPLFTGSMILVAPNWRDCRSCSQMLPGFVASPTTLRHAPLPLGPLGLATPMTYAWTGRAVLAVNVYGTRYVGAGPDMKSLPTPRDEMALYDPATGRWRTLPAPPGHPWLGGPPVWAGTQLLELTGGNGTMLTFHP